MTVWFTADTHWGHTNIIKHASRPFSSTREMDETLIQNWNAVVGAKDTVYHLGDVGLCSPGLLNRILGQLNGHIFLIQGNHDRTTISPQCRGRFKGISCLMEARFPDPSAPRGERTIILCHYAMRVWNKRHWGSWHLYGHSHGKLPEDPQSLSFDVGVDAHGYRPISFKQVSYRMGQKTNGFKHHDRKVDT